MQEWLTRHVGYKLFKIVAFTQKLKFLSLAIHTVNHLFEETVSFCSFLKTLCQMLKLEYPQSAWFMLSSRMLLGKTEHKTKWFGFQN